MDERFSLEELQSINHERIMTQSVFNSILDKCMEVDADELFYRLLNEYPKFLAEYANPILQEIDLSKAELFTDEMDERVWNNLLKEINNRDL